MNLLQKKLQHNIISEYFYSFINNLSMSNSIWVLYLAYRGMSLLEIGLLEGIYHITGLLFEIPSGAAADLLGRKRSMLVSRILMIFSCIIMLFSNTFAGFALSFILQSLSGNFNSGSEEALVYDSLKQLETEENYPIINGRINMLIEVSQSVATVLGGILAEYSFSYCYATSTVIAALGLIPLLFMTEPTIGKTATAEHTSVCSTVKKHFQTSAAILQKDRQILLIIVYYSAVFSAFNTLFFYGQQYFYELGLNKIEISIVMLFAGLAACLGALSNNSFSKLLGRKTALFGALMISLSILLFGFYHLYLSIGALLVATFFNSVLYPVQSNALNQRIPSAQRATLISVNSMFFSVFMILIFPLAGAFADITNLATAFVLLGAVTLLCSLLYYKKLF